MLKSASVPLFPSFSESLKHQFRDHYPVHIWKVSPQLRCGDTCQIRCERGLKKVTILFCNISNFHNGKIDKRSFNNPHHRYVIMDSISVNLRPPENYFGSLPSVVKHIPGCIMVRIGFIQSSPNTWWRHQMETFSALLALCAENSPVTDEFPSQRPVTRSFDVFFDLSWIKGWVNNRDAGDLRPHCNETCIAIW